jgi:hypothetical protein
MPSELTKFCAALYVLSTLNEVVSHIIYGCVRNMM